jgi:glycosyltransferase involved in cell wall biosynthesis
MQYPIDIVLITWQRPDLTFQVIEAIKQNTNRDQYRLIVVDNNSHPDMQARLYELDKSGVIDNLVLNDRNYGLEPARNIGLKKVTSELFVCADNDCLPEKRIDGKTWLERLVTLMDELPEFSAISCRTQVMIGTGNIFEYGDVSGDDVVEFPHPGGSFRIMRTEDTRKAGGWRDTVEGRGAEERTIGGRLREQGHKVGFAVNIRCLHLFGTRGTMGTDRWGYPKDWEPEDTGHSNIWHPVLERGDDINEIKKYMDV